MRGGGGGGGEREGRWLQRVENEGRVGHTRVPRRVDVRYDALSRAYRHRGNPRTSRKRERKREREKSPVEKKFYSATIHKVRENDYKFRERREREGGSRDRRGVERKRERERERKRERGRVWSGVFLPQEEAAEGVEEEEEEEEARNRVA